MRSIVFWGKSASLCVDIGCPFRYANTISAGLPPSNVRSKKPSVFAREVIGVYPQTRNEHHAMELSAVSANSPSNRSPVSVLIDRKLPQDRVFLLCGSDHFRNWYGWTEKYRPPSCFRCQTQEVHNSSDMDTFTKRCSDDGFFRAGHIYC